MRKVIAAAAFAMATGAASAEDVAGGLSIGTLGAGAQLAFALSESFNLRIGANGGAFDFDYAQDDIEYDARAKLFNAPLILDWFPAKGLFRLSVGVAANGNKVDVTGRPRAGSFTIGNDTYNAADVGSIDGEVKYKSVAPYIGVGWGNAVAPSKKLGWNLDLGVLYQGRPKSTYNVTCGSALTAAQCAALQNDAAIEADEFDRELQKYRWYPVAQFWLSWQF